MVFPSDAVNRLTERQCEIIPLLADGLTRKHIAEILGISLKTVEFHLQSVDRVLSRHDDAALTQFAIAVGWVKVKLWNRSPTSKR